MPAPAGGLVVRRVEEASATIDFFHGPRPQLRRGIRPEVSLLVARRRGDTTAVVSAGGPLTREELDLVHTVGDPLVLSDLLPAGPVSQGAAWDVPPSVAKAWSEYDNLSSSSLKATLAELGEKQARISVAGEIKGSVHGSQGSMAIAGEAVFDRPQGLITSLKLERAEARREGPIELPLQAKSTVTLKRNRVEPPPELSDAALAGLPTEDDPRRELLLLRPASGRFQLLHDRAWYAMDDDARHVVLLRLEGTRVVARCDLMPGPPAGAGRHQDLGQFRDDVRRALGNQFGQIVGEGEVGDDGSGTFRYKIAVESPEGDNGLVPLRYYYLVASPAGEQAYAVFTLSRATEAEFGDQDTRLMATIDWLKPSSPRR